MLWRFIILSLLCIARARTGPSSIIVPCKKSDVVCMAISANKASPIIAAGIPTLGVDGFDPGRLPEVSGEISKFIFNFTENEVSGYKKCVISDVKSNLELMKLKFDVMCPSLMATGHLVVSGELFDVPVEGDDDYKMICGKYLIEIEVDIEKQKGADGRSHLVFTTFKHKGVPLEPYKFHYINFKPKKQLSPETAAAFGEKFLEALEHRVFSFVNKLYKEVIFKSVNKFFESIPFEDLFID